MNDSIFHTAVSDQMPIEFLLEAEKVRTFAWGALKEANLILQSTKGDHDLESWGKQIIDIYKARGITIHRLETVADQNGSVYLGVHKATRFIVKDPKDPQFSTIQYQVIGLDELHCSVNVSEILQYAFVKTKDKEATPMNYLKLESLAQIKVYLEHHVRYTDSFIKIYNKVKPQIDTFPTDRVRTLLEEIYTVANKFMNEEGFCKALSKAVGDRIQQDRRNPPRIVTQKRRREAISIKTTKSNHQEYYYADVGKMMSVKERRKYFRKQRSRVRDKDIEKEDIHFASSSPPPRSPTPEATPSPEPMVIDHSIIDGVPLPEEVANLQANIIAVDLGLIQDDFIVIDEPEYLIVVPHNVDQAVPEEFALGLGKPPIPPQLDEGHNPRAQVAAVNEDNQNEENDNEDGDGVDDGENGGEEDDGGEDEDEVEQDIDEADGGDDGDDHDEHRGGVDEQRNGPENIARRGDNQEVLPAAAQAVNQPAAQPIAVALVGDTNAIAAAQEHGINNGNRAAQLQGSSNPGIAAQGEAAGQAIEPSAEIPEVAGGRVNEAVAANGATQGMNQERVGNGVPGAVAEDHEAALQEAVTAARTAQLQARQRELDAEIALMVYRRAQIVGLIAAENTAPQTAEERAAAQNC